jgi:anaerobic magnesium-protoporphyrin IX monomethyl ester cyclase
MKVLLINPNRYQSPPVPPIGLEHIAAYLRTGGHEVAVLDLCFCEAPFEELDRTISGFKPDIAGITVRNVDSVLYQTNEFFLDGIREMVAYIRDNYALKVVIGGTGVSANPEAVRAYLGAEYAIAGPGEEAVNDLLRQIGSGGNPGAIQHRKYRYDLSCPRDAAKIDYRRYYERGGTAGFETHKGCGSSCVYCLEANTPVSYKAIEEVITEIRWFVEAGHRRFHLCDAEFNEDVDYCTDFCEALRREGLDIDWAVYMKPANFKKRLFPLMRDCGVSLVTLTVDSWKKCPLYYADIEKIVFAARSSRLKVAVDFLAGFPYETEDTLVFYLDLFRRLQPDSVGINTYIRLYRFLQITNIIMRDEALKKYLIGHVEDKTLLKPVFYNQVSVERLRELINGDDLFRIEGIEKGVNYQRLGR